MADPTPQQLAKALTLNERMGEWAKRLDPNYRSVPAGMKLDEYQEREAARLGVSGWLTQGPPKSESEFSRPADLPSGMFERDAAKLGRGAIGLFNSAIDGLAKAGLSFGFVNNGGVLTDNEITDTALNILGGGSTFSKAIGAKAVGGPGGKVLGANVPGGPPHRWLPSHQKEAWDQIPSVAEKVKARMENELGVPVTISQSDTNYGRSWYVKPQIESFTGEGPFSVRVSDHGATARPQEARIYMVDGPTRTVATPEYVDAQIEKAIEFAKTYKARNSSVLPGHVAQGGQWNENDVTDSALNIAGMSGFGSMGLGAKAVGGQGGKVLGMGVMNDPPPAFVLKADGVPGRAKELAELLQSQMPDAKVSISHNKSGVGESSYVTATYMPPHRKTGKYMTGEFRVSDHGVGPRRLGDYQDHINVGDPYDASKSINRMLESYARYKQETGTPHHLPTDTASRMARAEDAQYNYARRSQNADSPDNGTGYAMFAEKRPLQESVIDRLDDLSGYGKHGWLASAKGAVPVEDIQKDIVRALRNRGLHEEYQTTAANLSRSANPEDIVNSAGLWDEPRLVSAVYEDVLEPKGITAIKTADGLLSFNHPYVRSEKAFFDPAKADSADLLAMTGNPAMLAAGQNQDAGPSKMALELAKRLSDQEFYAKGGI